MDRLFETGYWELGCIGCSLRTVCEYTKVHATPIAQWGEGDEIQIVEHPTGRTKVRGLNGVSCQDFLIMRGVYGVRVFGAKRRPPTLEKYALATSAAPFPTSLRVFPTLTVCLVWRAYFCWLNFGRPATLGLELEPET